ncbi:MAG: YajQ family cyclic di-GMP-binding protein [Gammaproteobacteria bacterium]|nr:YajQ family cyclic di-GMP-binding protein [Gammaproteobacteria bacterium]
MASFDVVSRIDMHELANAVDQANRELTTRFDFKGTNSRVERNETALTLIAPAEFQIKQLTDILQIRLAKRGIDIRCLEYGTLQQSVHEARQTITVREGINADLARKLVKIVKDSRLKVQAQIQGEQLRVSGKKKDDLQQVIAILRAAKVEMPLQFVNFRD